MSIKDDLHTLVDQLDDDEAVVAISYLREILDAESAASSPPIVSGKVFFAEKPRRDPIELAREQGKLPLSSFDDLLGDFWPEEESVDEFIETVRRWRREGGFA